MSTTTPFERKVYKSKKYGDFVLLDKFRLQGYADNIYMTIMFSYKYGLIYMPYNIDDTNLKDLYRLMIMDECDLWKRVIVANNPLTIRGLNINTFIEITNLPLYIENMMLCIKDGVDYLTGSKISNIELIDFSVWFNNINITHNSERILFPFTNKEYKELDKIRFIFNNILVELPPKSPTSNINMHIDSPLKLFITSVASQNMLKKDLRLSNNLSGSVDIISNINERYLYDKEHTYIVSQDDNNIKIKYDKVHDESYLTGNLRHKMDHRCKKCKCPLNTIICTQCEHINI